MSGKIIIREMSSIEFQKYRDMVIGEYTEDIIDANRNESEKISMEEAHKQAVCQFEALAPKDGKCTENNCLYMVEADHKRVGIFWYYITNIMDEDIAFIADIRVDETKRNQGYGRSILKDFEKEAKSKGYHNLGVYVKSNNRGAVRLFESEDYKKVCRDGNLLYLKKVI